MRQRVTYILPQGSGVDPADISLEKAELRFTKAQEAAEERRITLGVSELPKELQLFLEDFHELHVRVASRHPYNAFIPAVSRVAPGLHIFFTPRTPGGSTKLCSSLRRVLHDSVKCADSPESFSRPPILSERFASSSTYQVFHNPYFLDLFQILLRPKTCRALFSTASAQGLCTEIADSTPPTYMDIDFDVISHALNIVLLWAPDPQGNHLSRPAARKYATEDRLEVGILSPEKADEPEEISLGGYLTVVGDDDKPGATLFSFPSRHHPLPPTSRTSYITHFNTPTGLHPTLNITFRSGVPTPPKEDSTCALHAYLTFPSYLFIDRYQLSDPLLLSSHNLISLRAISGAQDLEAPDWAINTWGSAALFQLSTPSEKQSFSATIPLHLRYINATSSTSNDEDPDDEVELPVPWPVVFWACEAEDGLKMATNPFDRVNLGYDGLFGPKTMFYHVPPAPGYGMVETLSPPTLKDEWNEWVPMGTSLAVLVGFAWVCWQLLRPVKTKAVTTETDGKKTR